MLCLAATKVHTLVDQLGSVAAVEDHELNWITLALKAFLLLFEQIFNFTPLFLANWLSCTLSMFLTVVHKCVKGQSTFFGFAFKSVNSV